MDADTHELSSSSVKILGIGIVSPENLNLTSAPSNLDTPFDVAPVLKDRKSLKLMAKQDQMALLAAHRAIVDSGLSPDEVKTLAGIYLTTGILPFEEDQLELLATRSSVNGKFDMNRFSTEAFQALNPLLTFRCLPNMPVFHISFNLGIRETHFITYSGVGQWLLSLKRACDDLRRGFVKYALVGAVADRRNALVRHYINRLSPESSDLLIDSSCFWLLSLNEGPNERGVLTSVETRYSPSDPFKLEFFKDDLETLKVSAGPVTPALWASLKMKEMSEGSTIKFPIHAPDGISGSVILERRI